MPLYKYLHEERLSILEDGLIRFSPPQPLNDPIELKPHVSQLAGDHYFDSHFYTTLLVMPHATADCTRTPSFIRLLALV